MRLSLLFIAIFIIAFLYVGVPVYSYLLNKYPLAVALNIFLSYIFYLWTRSLKISRLSSFVFSLYILLIAIIPFFILIPMMFFIVFGQLEREFEKKEGGQHAS